MIYKLARQNAIPLELKKDGLSQRQSGDWVLRFVVQASEMDERLMKAAMGTRFQAALVEINDDETPTQPQPVKELPASMLHEHVVRASWQDIPPAQQAGIRSHDPIFKVFLQEKYLSDWNRSDWNGNGPDNAECIRRICGIKSRSQLSTNHKALVIWHQLDTEFQAWKLADA